ncbi:MAG: VWA-like domain-containing protein [Rhodopila sp.]|jgi:predicted metal-dependent peptidase
MAAASDLFAKARAALLVNAPFWGVLSLRLAPVEDPSIETMETNGVSIRYNPDFVAGLSRGLLRTIIAHETMHCAALHHTRRDGRDPQRWNIACDHAINPLLAEAGFELPDGALLDPAYAGLSAEEIYARLPRDAGENGDGPDGNDPGGMGGVADPPTGGDQAGDRTGDPGPSGEPGVGAPSAADLARQEETWLIATAQAEATAKAMGVGAGEAARAIRDQVAPKVDWRDVLRRYLSAAAKSDYAWTPPNRRYIARGIYLPSLRSETLGPVVVAVDTSGSIDDATLAAFAAEISAIMDEAVPEAIHVVYCDDAVAGTETYGPGDVVHLTPHGGGGTAFRPVFDWIARSDIQPVCVVYLTDLCGSDFGPAPDYPVLWVSTDLSHAPFGEVIPHR